MSNRRKPRAAGLASDALLQACADMLPRLGALSFETRFSEPEHDGSPVVWIAVAAFARGGNTIHEVGAALTPERAAFRLLETLVDGGRCTHCDRPTGITDDFNVMPASQQVCWYQFDPELTRFRRSCA